MKFHNIGDTTAQLNLFRVPVANEVYTESV